MRRVGFYASADEIAIAETVVQRSWEGGVVEYLKNGILVLSSPHWIDDLLDGARVKICQYSVMTDGLWIWTSDLAYYLSEYHVELPLDFIDHVSARNYAVPSIDEKIMNDALAELGLSDMPESPVQEG